MMKSSLKRVLQAYFWFMNSTTASIIFILVMLHLVAGFAWLAYKMRKRN